LVSPGIEPETSGLAARNSDYQNTEAVGDVELMGKLEKRKMLVESMQFSRRLRENVKIYITERWGEAVKCT
jgi:hypothetical protein